MAMESWKRALPLPGWEQASVWGWDIAEGSLFAQLYLNGDDGGDEARIWITTLTGWPATADPQELAEWISDVTGGSMAEALIALANQAPGRMGDDLRALIGSRPLPG